MVAAWLILVIAYAVRRLPYTVGFILGITAIMLFVAFRSLLRRRTRIGDTDQLQPQPRPSRSTRGVERVEPR